MAQSSPVPAHRRTKHVQAYAPCSALTESHMLTQDLEGSDLAKGQKSLAASLVRFNKARIKNKNFAARGEILERFGVFGE